MDNDYGADQLQVLEGLEPVRRRPAMYIGDNGIKGLHHLVEELVANSVDEALAGHCTVIDVIVHPDCSVSVTDNGRGIPVGVHSGTGLPGLELAMTKLHAGGKFGGGAYKISGGLHGVGLSCVNALSEWTEAEIHQSGRIWRQRYERGPAVTPLQDAGPTQRNGTTIRFKPDHQIFAKIEFRADMLTNRLRELAFLNKGIKITFTDERTGQHEEFLYKGGIIEFVEHLNRNKEPVVPRSRSAMRSREDVEVRSRFNTTALSGEHSLVPITSTPRRAARTLRVQDGDHASSTSMRAKRILKDKDPNPPAMMSRASPPWCR